MQPARRAIVPALPALAVAGLLGVILAGCSGGIVDPDAAPTGATTTAAAEASDGPSEEPSDGPSVAPAEEPSEEPAEEAADPLADRPTEAPAQRVDAGTVAAGSAAQADGTGSAEVTFVRDGEFAVVVHLDCGECAGTRAFMAPTKIAPYAGRLGRTTGSYLMDVFEDSDPQQSLWLETDGAWSVRLESWNDLPVVSGPQSGTGPTVLLLDGSTANAEVAWEPADAEDSFQGRFFGVDRAAARMFGDTEAFTDVVEMPLPGALAITTEGTWSVTPTD